MEPVFIAAGVALVAYGGARSTRASTWRAWLLWLAVGLVGVGLILEGAA